MPSCRLGKARLGIRARVTEECEVQSGKRQGPLPPVSLALAGPAVGRVRVRVTGPLYLGSPPLQPREELARGHFCLGRGSCARRLPAAPRSFSPYVFAPVFHLPFSPSPRWPVQVCSLPGFRVRVSFFPRALSDTAWSPGLGTARRPGPVTALPVPSGPSWPATPVQAPTGCLAPPPALNPLVARVTGTRSMRFS